jgi:hypothetical protein
VLVETLSRWRRPTAQDRPQSLEDRLRDLGDLMRSSSRVLEEVQAEIQARITLAENAKRDADEAEQLAQLNDAQRAALARLVRAEVSGEISRGGRRSFWLGVVVNFVFFAAGVGVTVVLTTWLS